MTVDVKWNGETYAVTGEIVSGSFKATSICHKGWELINGMNRRVLAMFNHYALWEIMTTPWLDEQKERERKLAGMIPAKVGN